MAPTSKKSKVIDTPAKLERRIPALIDAIGADPALALRAAANPILAIEELGYELGHEVRVELERRLRFPPETRTRLSELAERVCESAGRRFDIDDPDALAAALFDDLGLKPPAEPGGKPAAQYAPRGEGAGRSITERPSPAVFGRRLDDPMEVLRGVHPVIEPLLEYRRLEAGEPRFAPPSLYERIRRGEVKPPVTAVRLRTGSDRDAPVKR